MWRFNHTILHPSPQPLRVNPYELNEHFASTNQRVTSAAAETVDNLWNLIDALPDHNDDAFSLRHVTCHEVAHELKRLRSDTSCDHNGIPVKFIKLVSNCMVSPLTHIINNCLSKKTFHHLGKTHESVPYRRAPKSKPTMTSVLYLFYRPCQRSMSASC